MDGSVLYETYHIHITRLPPLPGLARGKPSGELRVWGWGLEPGNWGLSGVRRYEGGGDEGGGKGEAHVRMQRPILI